MIQELQTAITSRAITSNTFATGISNKFYYSIAPLGATGKYAILSDVANPNSIDTGNLFEECYFQIAIYETSTAGISSSAGVHTLATYCKTLFDNCLGIMTVTNYNLTHFRRMNIIGPRSTQLNDGFVIILNYYATLQKGR
jgi:hypothetical protein